MRAVVQRVSEASVTIGGELVSSIDSGAVVLLGVATEDRSAEVRWMADKVVNLRIFSDEHGKMNRSLLDVSGEALVVSQFTLYGDARKGRRPAFVRAAQGATAQEMYESFVNLLCAAGVDTSTGEFGATMKVALINDGPVTILLDSERKF